MSIPLKKHSGIKLTKNNTDSEGLHAISLGLGWDEAKDGYITVEREVVEKSGGFLGFGAKKVVKTAQEKFYVGRVDIDATVLAYKHGMLVGECSFRTNESPIMYKGKMVLKHSGDDTTGGRSKSGDDETINVFLGNMDDFADTLYLVLNVYTSQTLDMVQNAYVKVYDENKEELAYFNLSEDYRGKKGSIVGKAVINENHTWEFIALGDGVNVRGIDDLIKIAPKY